MSRKHSKTKDLIPRPVKENDYKNANHMKAKFKEFVKTVSYKELIQEYNRVKNLIMILSSPTYRFKPQTKGTENLRDLRYKNSLLTTKLLSITQKSQDIKPTKRTYSR